MIHKLAQSILNDANNLFDIAGITSSGDDNWLILGMITSKERDLDEFIRQEDGEVNFVSGFEKYIRPRLEKLVDSATQLGVDAEIFGNCGYPRGSDLNIKQSVVAAGLAQWGRNSMVLHPEHGLNLRFSVVKLRGTRLPSTGPGKVDYELSPLCTSCQDCRQACPVNVIGDGRLTDSGVCLANFKHMTGDKKLLWCRECIDVCPFGKG